jgi:hypothetical protein
LLLHLVEDRCLTEKELREIERSIAKTQEKKS